MRGKGGGGGGRSTKKYSRKGKLNEKKNSCTPVKPKTYSFYGLRKIHTRNLIKKKIPAAQKFPTPSHNFSNGPSNKPPGEVILTK